MTTLITILVIAAVIAFLAMINTGGSSFLDREPVDRDRDRLVHDLQVHPR